MVVQDRGSGRPTVGSQSSLELARVNRRIVDEVCVAVLRSLPSHSPLITSLSCLSPSEALAYKARLWATLIFGPSNGSSTATNVVVLLCLVVVVRFSNH